jgi:hypothetical protein
VNPDRSTTSPTASRWINIIQRGSTEEWRDLYRLCRNRDFAEEVAHSLPLRDPDLLASARLWTFLLEDLHPGLKTDIRENDTRTAL